MHHANGPGVAVYFDELAIADCTHCLSISPGMPRTTQRQDSGNKSFFEKVKDVFGGG
jgi:hypothetical protein